MAQGEIGSLSMAKNPRHSGGGTTPDEREGGTTPLELYDMSDIRLVIRALGKLEAQVERLISDVGEQGKLIATLNTSVVRAKTSIYVTGACLAIFLPMLGGLLWWSVGERIESVLRPRAVTIEAPRSPTSAATDRSAQIPAGTYQPGSK